MKSLQESLFDHDIEKSDVLLGELYKLSDVSNYNMVTNDIRKVLAMFDERILKKEKFPHKVSLDHGFISYWKKHDSRIDLFINMFLNTPMQEFEKIFKEPWKGNKQLADYLSKYFSYGGGKAKNIYISGRSMNNRDLLEITIYDNIDLSTPSSIQLTFEKR